jgi:alkylation response protein AidB-like acyl-CoA dehydrogenase
MSTELFEGKGKGKEELEAMAVAEEAREAEWELPSFTAELFMGKLDLDSILPYPEQSEDDKRVGDEFLRRLDAFLRSKLDPEEIDRTGEISPAVMKGLADLGAFGMKIPKEYGGLGLSQINYNRAMAVICGYCPSTGALLSAHQSIGVPQPLRLFGTEEQKRKYLPRLAAGAVSAFALTEPGVGSDPAQMSTTATPVDGGESYVLNGTKLWCTNGAIADILVVMAQTPSITVKGREKKQITAFIVEKGTPGFEVLHRCRFMGLNGIQNALLGFKNVKVPKENIIWGLGKGLRLALITLNAGRLSLPAGCIGGARRMIEGARMWGNERKQWGAPIGKHEAIAHKIAQMSASLFAMESMTWLAGAWVDRKTHDIRLEAAMAKVFCSEQSWKMIDELLQMRGGRGYERASSLAARGEIPMPIERAMRDARINMIVEGTSEILRLFIAREALDRHLKIAGDVLNPKLPIGRRLAAVVRAGMFYAVWYPSQWLGSLLGWLPSGGMLGSHLSYARRSSHRLARSVFHLMALNGPKLEKRQMQLSRVVDIATDLLAITASVSRARALTAKPNADQNVVDVAGLFCATARLRVEANFKALRRNTDAAERAVSRSVLEGRALWQESNAFEPLPAANGAAGGNGLRSVAAPAAAATVKNPTWVR